MPYYEPMHALRFTMPELEDFIDRWGSKPDEWFVVFTNHDSGTAGLAKDACGSVARTVLFTRLSYPNGTSAPRFYPGDMVTCAPSFEDADGWYAAELARQKDNAPA